MTAELKVVQSIYDSNFRNIAATLRAIADGIEAGQYGEVDQIALVMHGEDVKVFGLGDSTGSNVHLLLACAGRTLENAVLFE